QSQASVPPAPGLIDTTAEAESCLPLIMAWSSNASYWLSAFTSAGSISDSNDGSSSANSAIVLISAAAVVLSSYGFSVEFNALIWRITPGVFSLLVQKSGSPCLASRASRAAVLLAMSKRVPQLCEPGAEFVGSPPEIGIHCRCPS